MIASNPVQTVPLRTDPDGVVRVGQSRVSLESIVIAHKLGQSPEQIAYSYDTVQLADVYAILAYYHAHLDEVEGYLAASAAEGDRLREEIEREFPQAGLKARLVARMPDRASS